MNEIINEPPTKKVFFEAPKLDINSLINFSTQRTGSTKLLNLFEAACYILGLTVFISKSHPNSYKDIDLDFSMINDKMIILCSQRNILEQVKSYIRVFSNSNQSLNTNLIRTINLIVKHKREERLILNKALCNGVSFCLADYNYLTKYPPNKLLRDAVEILGKSFKINSYKSIFSEFCKDKPRFNKLIAERGLTTQSAINIQKNLGEDFSLADLKTSIHGNHINTENCKSNNNFFQKELVIEQKHYSEMIYEKHISKLLKLAREKKAQGKITYWKYLSSHDS